MGKVLASGGGGGGTGSDECTANKAQVLAGYTAVTSDSGDEAAEGTMPNNGAINASLNCGDSKTIPAGYTSGGTVTSNSLASQTQGTAAANQISSEKTAWVNGKKVTGTLTERGQYQSGGGAAWCNTYFAINSLPEGIYRKNGASWAPEARCTADQLRNVLGITANKIKTGQTIAGVSGNVNEYGMVENSYKTGDTSEIVYKDTGTSLRRYMITIENFGLNPAMVFAHYGNYVSAYDGYNYYSTNANGTADYIKPNSGAAVLTANKVCIPVMAKGGPYLVRIVGYRV